MIRDYWLKFTKAEMKVWLIQNWDNILTVIKNKNIIFEGQRHFLSHASGQPQQ